MRTGVRVGHVQRAPECLFGQADLMPRLGEAAVQGVKVAVVLEAKPGPRRPFGGADHQHSAVLGCEVRGLVVIGKRPEARADIAQGLCRGPRILREPDLDDGEGRVRVG